MSAFRLEVQQFGGTWRKSGGLTPVVGYRALEGGPLGFLTPRIDQGDALALDEWREYRIARFVFVTAGICIHCGQQLGVMTSQHRPILYTADEIALQPSWSARLATPAELARGIAFYELKRGAS